MAVILIVNTRDTRKPRVKFKSSPTPDQIVAWARAVSELRVELSPALLPPWHFGLRFTKCSGAGWQREHMSQNRLAILPNLTHYEIGTAPELADTALPFLNDRTAPRAGAIK
jgi:hypothetical protein